MDLLVWVIAIVLAVASAAAAHLARRRRGELAAVAARNGLQFSDDDPFDCTRLASFPVLRLGDRRGSRHVMWREGARGPVRAFDFWYEREKRDPQQRTVTHVKSCVLAFVNGSWPALSVRPEGLADRVVDGITGIDIDFESEDFNRMFTVRCDDRRFASALLDPQMLEVLLDTKGMFTLDLRGRWLLLHRDQVPPSAVPGMMRVAERIVAAVPPVVWELYPTPFVDGAGAHLPPGDDDLARRRRAAEDAAGDPFTAGREGRFGPVLDALEDDGVDHDLDGKPLPARDEDPWGGGTRGS